MKKSEAVPGTDRTRFRSTAPTQLPQTSALSNRTPAVQPLTESLGANESLRMPAGLSELPAVPQSGISEKIAPIEPET